MGSGGAPDYAKTTTDLGQFGSATADKHGAKWKATDWQKGFINQMQDTANDSWSKAVNREVSEAAIDNFNRQFTNDFNNNYLQGALKNNLLRGSSASDLYATANNNYLNDRYNLTTQEMNNNLNLANNALNNYFNMSNLAQALVSNAQGNSNAISNYNLNAYKAEQDANNAMWGNIMKLGGDLAGAAGTAYGGKK